MVAYARRTCCNSHEFEDHDELCFYPKWRELKSVLDIIIRETGGDDPASLGVDYGGTGLDRHPDVQTMRRLVAHEEAKLEAAQRTIKALRSQEGD